MARIPIRMPKMSMTMTEGEVSEWFVEPGDVIAEGDVICEVLTDKVDMEVESPASGVLTSIEVESGSVDVGVAIGWLDGDDSGGLGDLLAPAEAATERSATEAAPKDAVPTADDGPRPDYSSEPAAPAPVPRATGPVAAVPRARALAREHGVPLGDVTSSRDDGLITVADVEARLGTGRQAGEPPADSPGHRLAAMPGQPSPRRAIVRARVAAKMIESAAIPQFTLWRDLRLDGADRERGKTSWTTVLLRAYAAALREVPALLCRWEDNAAVESGDPSIGLAIATPDGLLAPTLAAPDEGDPSELDEAIRELVAAARNGRVAASYLLPANAMLSNLGGLGVDRFQALVTPPQASVLAVGSIAPRPVAVPGGVGTALSATVGLTVDHRVGDGADGALLLDALASALGPSA